MSDGVISSILVQVHSIRVACRIALEPAGQLRRVHAMADVVEAGFVVMEIAGKEDRVAVSKRRVRDVAHNAVAHHGQVLVAFGRVVTLEDPHVAVWVVLVAFDDVGALPQGDHVPVRILAVEVALGAAFGIAGRIVKVEAVAIVIGVHTHRKDLVHVLRTKMRNRPFALRRSRQTCRAQLSSSTVCSHLFL